MNIRKLLGLQDYQPLNLIEISESNLLQNYKLLSEDCNSSNYKVLSGINKKVKIAPVLKSNAYGHGLILVAKVLDNVGAPYFCVDSIYEAYELLKAKIKTPILIMGYINPDNLKVKKLPFAYAISTMDLAQSISKYQPQAGVHIFVDTRMHREGVPLSELPNFLQKLPKNLNVEGLMSHLASGELSNDPLTKLQIKNFQKAQEIVKKFGLDPKWVHLLNSAGSLNNLNPGCNMTRVGLALYGISPHPTSYNLKPVLKLTTKLIQIKKLEKEERIGYNGTFVAKKPMTVGILPIGYFDGVDRRLSNKGYVIINGKTCTIVGNISMNITTVDVTHVPNLKIGQEVTVYSNNPEDKNSIQNAAKICQTIPYELLIHLAPSTKRIIV